MEELDAFLAMASQFGLYSIVRVGPYICSEWDTGGYPQWLMAHIPRGYRDMWVRTDNPHYTQWANHWMSAVCPVIARHQLTRKAHGKRGVILVQVENEYQLIGVPLGHKKRHLADLIKQARSHSINVPLFTNLAGFIVDSHGPLAHQVSDTIDRYPGWDLAAMGHRIKHYRTGQLDAPVMGAEMQGGWQTSIGGVPSLRTDVDYYPDMLSPAQINALTLYSIAHDMTAINYYMIFGGTNFASHATSGIDTTYDYIAAIRECGGVGAKWQIVKSLGLTLRTHGAALARSRKVSIATAERTPLELWARQSPDGSDCIFIFNPNRAQARLGRLDLSVGLHRNVVVNYHLSAGDFQLLYLTAHTQGNPRPQWLLERQPLPRRPTRIPPAVPITHFRLHAEPLPSEWKVVPHGHSLDQMGVNQGGFSYYRCSIVSSSETHAPAGKAALAIFLPSRDSSIALVDGEVALPLAASGTPAILPLRQGVATTNKVACLYENTGHPDNGWAMQMPFGITDVGLMPYSSDEDLITDWRIRLVKLPHHVQRLPEIGPQWDDSKWRKVKVSSRLSPPIDHGRTAVMRARATFSDTDIHRGKTLLRFFNVSSQAWLFVNGKEIGVITGPGASANLAHAIRSGLNSIVLVVQALGRSGGIAAAQLLYQPNALGKRERPLLLSAQPSGVSGHWYIPEFDDRHWPQQPLGFNEPNPAALLTWYRVEFELSQVADDIWVPWCLRLAARGNGFIYVNGHCIGRYWQRRHQREFFIPDNWLNTRGKNTVALCLRPVDSATGVSAASIVPYKIYAEHKAEGAAIRSWRWTDPAEIAGRTNA